MCDEAIDDSLAALKLFQDWFVTSKMIKKLYTALYAGDGLLFLDENFGNVTFCCNEMGFLSVNDNNINLDSNFDEDDSDTVILIKLQVELLNGHSKFKKLKALNALYTI